MKAKGSGFYIVCVLSIVLVGVIVWDVASSRGVEEDSGSSSVVVEERQARVEQPKSASVSKVQAKRLVPKREVMDDAKLFELLEAGGVATQDSGERGSLEGALATKSPMKLAQSSYAYLPNSPLLEFTDDMIWKEGENTYVVKKDAISIQARHIQEASVALSVSPRVEWEKTTGYRLVEIPENSLFSKLGMVSGDIVVSINGAMPDMEPMALMFVNMVAGKRGASTIVVEHRGVKRTIELRAAE